VENWHLKEGADRWARGLALPGCLSPFTAVWCPLESSRCFWCPSRCK
jgi:hypothetical protein